MLLLAAVTALTDHFLATFTAAPIALDNGPVVERSDPFVHLTIQVGPSQPNLDSTFKRTTGVAIVRVMVPKGHGDLVAWSLAQSVAAALELRTVGGSIRLTSADYVNAGLLGDQLEVDTQWYQVNVNVPFWFEHVVV